MGHPDFRVNGRIFATLHPGDTRGMVKVSPDEQRELLRTHPEAFEPSAGAWGRQGCTNVTLAKVDVRTARAALLVAYEGALKAPARRRRKPRV